MVHNMGKIANFGYGSAVTAEAIGAESQWLMAMSCHFAWKILMLSMVIGIPYAIKRPRANNRGPKLILKKL